MQRAVVGALRPVAKTVLAAGAGTSAAHCRAATEAQPSAAPAGKDEDWDWVTFKREEIRGALQEICSVGAVPVITEVSDDESETSSVTTTGSVDRLLARPDFGGAFESLDMVVTNLLNDPEAGRAIHNCLVADPEFRRMLLGYQHESAFMALPAALEGGSLNKEEHGNPLHALLHGAHALLAHIGNACAALGGHLRRLSEDIRLVLQGKRVNRAGLYHDAEASAQEMQEALKRIAVGVAVVIISHRILRISPRILRVA